MKKFYKIAVALSGGVDSAVSALLLKNKGFHVMGVFMKNWDDISELGYCIGEKEFKDAQIVSKILGIDLHEINFVKYYWNYVFCDFLEDYKNGLTPNPDILCNRYIKFDKFFKYCFNNLQVDAIATGHYARTSFGTFLENYDDSDDVKLLKSVDKFKDQTFFLSQVKQESLRKTMFPIGEMEKNKVKEIAKEAGLDLIAKKKESTGICFIGNRNFKKFINEYLDSLPGNFVDIDTGKIVGQHNGIHQWTIGQRCRISGCLKPYFTAKKDVEKNIIYVAAGTDHPALLMKIVHASKPYWIRNFRLDLKKHYEFRFQHTKPLVGCIIENSTSGIKIILDIPARAITPGQFAVIYSNEECLGSARILNKI